MLRGISRSQRGIISRRVVLVGGKRFSVGFLWRIFTKDRKESPRVILAAWMQEARMHMNYPYLYLDAAHWTGTRFLDKDRGGEVFRTRLGSCNALNNAMTRSIRDKLLTFNSLNSVECTIVFEILILFVFDEYTKYRDTRKKLIYSQSEYSSITFNL